MTEEQYHEGDAEDNDDFTIYIPPSLEACFAGLPPGAPDRINDPPGLAKKRLTPEDKAHLGCLQGIAFYTAQKNGGLYCLPDVFEQVRERGIGGPNAKFLFRFIAGNNHKIAGTGYRWQRLPLPHHDYKIGRKWNVYKLVEEAVGKSECQCAWCPPR